MPDSTRNPTLAEIAHAHGEDHSGHIKIYLRVFIALAVFTRNWRNSPEPARIWNLSYLAAPRTIRERELCL